MYPGQCACVFAGSASRKIHSGPAGLCFHAFMFLRLGKAFVFRSPDAQIRLFCFLDLKLVRYAGLVFCSCMGDME